jgi:flagellar biosynthesis component FlhA
VEVRTQTSAALPMAVLRGDGRGTCGKSNLEVYMLLTLAVILVILAVIGGVAIHPLLFLIAVLAVLAFVVSRSGSRF